MTVFGIPLSDLMQAQRQKEEPNHPRPLMEAQREELMLRFQSYHDALAMIPGTLIVAKPGLGWMTPEMASRHAVMFWRYLDPGLRWDRELIADAAKRVSLNHVDCVVAYINDGGAALIFVPTDSRLFEPFDPSKHETA